MGMTTCKHCGGALATSAHRCPTCGGRRGVPRVMVVLTAIVGVLALGALIAVWGTVLSQS